MILLKIFQKGKEILAVSNFYKRIITTFLGLLFIFLGFIYIPDINIQLFNNDQMIHPLIFIALFFFILEILFQLKNNIYSRNLTMLFYSMIYLFFFMHVIFIQNIFENWKILFFYLMSQVFIIDIFGYLTGKIFGKTKLEFVNKISPNKTLEGYIGSVLFGGLWGILFLFFYQDDFQLEIFSKILLIFSLLTSSILGDLFVSKIKREIKVKDFSSLLYGHGGISDRLDSILPSFAIAFWIFFLF